MSDSDSDADSDAAIAPSDQTLEKGLRDEVASIFKSGNMEELTVKRVRLAVENKLGLTAGYFKTTGDWKARSEEIIKEEFVSISLHWALRSIWQIVINCEIMAIQDAQDQAAHEPETKPAEKSPSPAPKPKSAALAKRPKPESAPKPRKRQKTKTPVSDEDENEDEDEDAPSVASSEESDKVAETKKQLKPPVKRAPAAKPKKVAKKQESEASDVAGDISDDHKMTADNKDDSESEMSVVLDEEPKPKAPRKRQKSADGPAPKAKKAPKAKAKAKDEDVSPDQAEIKRLQGWLIKCGIRKLWGKELAPYDTPKAKIKHLKEMLEDAGMKGRPSQERANQIREERELKADLELIKEGAKNWGAKGEEGADDRKPRRRLNRGHQSLAFLDSDGDEEASEGSGDGKSRREANRGRQSLAFLDSDDGEETD
jgi:hypothetical protein